MNSTRERVLFGLRLSLGLGILACALYAVDARRLFQTLTSLEPIYFLAAFAASVAATIVVPAIVTSYTLAVAGIRLSLGDLIKINFAMRFYVLMLPHAVTVGMRWLRYRGARPGAGWRAAALLLFERVVQFVVIVLAGFLFLASQHSVPAVLRPLVPLSGVTSVVGLAAMLIFVSARAFRIVQPAIMFAMERSPRAISGRLGRLAAAVADYQRLQDRQVALVLLWAAGGHLLFIESAYIVAQGLSIPVTFGQIGWMRSLVVLLTVVPVTVGGLGVREAGFASLLFLHGVDGSAALAFPLVLLGIQVAIGLIGAMFEGLRVVVRNEKERRV